MVKDRGTEINVRRERLDPSQGGTAHTCKYLQASETGPVAMILSWQSGGVLLGIVFFAAVLLIKPIGVSAQFIIFDGLLWSAADGGPVVPADGGWTTSNAYLAKYAKNVANRLNYSVVFVIA
jgi:hypothetical protein